MYKSIVCLCIIIQLIMNPTSVYASNPVDEFLYINLWEKKVYLLNHQGKTIMVYPIAPGAKDTPSPVGFYKVTNKSKNWGGGFGSRWLGLDVTWGVYGIHGTNRPEKIGKYVSHGCFRMRNKDIEKLFEHVRVGTDVVIDGPIMGHEDLTYRILVPGSRGALVLLVQNRLRAAGFYDGNCHGKFDRKTEIAVKKFQKAEGLEISGQIHPVDLQHLGIIE